MVDLITKYLRAAEENYYHSKRNNDPTLMAIYSEVVITLSRLERDMVYETNTTTKCSSLEK